jgi:hypothetical protein
MRVANRKRVKKRAPAGTYTPYYQQQFDRLKVGTTRYIYWDRHVTPDKLQSIVTGRAFHMWGESSLMTWREPERERIGMFRIY